MPINFQGQDEEQILEDVYAVIHNALMDHNVKSLCAQLVSQQILGQAEQEMCRTSQDLLTCISRRTNAQIRVVLNILYDDPTQEIIKEAIDAAISKRLALRDEEWPKLC